MGPPSILNLQQRSHCLKHPVKVLSKLEVVRHQLDALADLVKRDGAASANSNGGQVSTNVVRSGGTELHPSCNSSARTSVEQRLLSRNGSANNEIERSSWTCELGFRTFNSRGPEGLGHSEESSRVLPDSLNNEPADSETSRSSSVYHENFQSPTDSAAAEVMKYSTTCLLVWSSHSSTNATANGSVQLGSASQTGTRTSEVEMSVRNNYSLRVPSKRLDKIPIYCSNGSSEGAGSDARKPDSEESEYEKESESAKRLFFVKSIMQSTPLSILVHRPNPSRPSLNIFTVLRCQSWNAATASLSTKAAEIMSEPSLPSTQTSVQPIEVSQSGKLLTMLSELRVASLPVGNSVHELLIDIVQQHIDAYAVTPPDTGRTSVNTHAITCEGRPLRHKLLPFQLAQRSCSTYELELYAVVRAVERFRVFLLARPFLLRTNHMALINLLKRDLPITTRVQKWILRLSEYNFTIEHQKGTANVMADILSRLPFASAAESEADSRRARPGPRGETSTPVSRALLGGEPTGQRSLASKEQIGSTGAATGEVAQSSATNSSASKCTRDACTQASSVCRGAQGSQALPIPTKINRGTTETLQSDLPPNNIASQNSNRQQDTSDPGFRTLTGRGLEGPRPPMYCLRVLSEPLYKGRIYSTYESSRDGDSNANDSESKHINFDEEEEEKVAPATAEPAAKTPNMYCLRVLPEPLYKYRIDSTYESSRVADSNATDCESEQINFEEEEDLEVAPATAESTARPPNMYSRRVLPGTLSKNLVYCISESARDADSYARENDGEKCNFEEEEKEEVEIETAEHTAGPPNYCPRVLPEPLPKHLVFCSYESMRDADSNASESESEES